MIRFLWRVLSALSLATLASGFVPIAAAIASDTPSIWMGLANEKARSFEWPGSGIEVLSTGKSVVVTLDDSGKNSLVVDNNGKLSTLHLRRGRQAYEFTAETSGQPNRIKLLRRTERMFGPTMLVSITTDGEILPGAKSKKQILAIGDSITAGYGIEGTDQSCKFSAETENQYLTYPAVAARQFGADISTIAISGIRVSPKFPADVTTMPFVFQQAYPKGREFDVIIVNLGTNDFSEKPKPNNFINAYTAFMADVRHKNPDAMIYAALGPMLSPDQFDEASTAIEAAVELRHKSGDKHIRFLALRTKAKGFGCNWHPSISTHEVLAETLIQTLERDLNWKKDAAN